MIPYHLTARQRTILVALSVILLGAGLFINLMLRFERRASPSASTEIGAPVGELPHGIVRVNGREIPVELALDEAAQEQGLSDRDALPADEGMLFVLPREEQQIFWMKGMRFPLDIIFIAGNRVVRVAANVPPPEGSELPAIVPSGVPADKVLEINAGKAKAWGISEGTEVEIEE